MSEPAKIDDRVTKLETEMVEVRYLAAKADQGVRLGRLERKVDHLDHKVDAGFAEMDSEMRRGFSVLNQGQEKITELLEARDDPEET
jgi:hypothetical protein